MTTDLEFHNAIIDALPFDVWGDNIPGHAIGTPDMIVTLLEKFEGRPSVDPNSDYCLYEDGAQGWEGEAFLLFQVSYQDEDLVNIYFKKFGTVSSYYETRWDGKFVRVHPRVKEITVYEYE